MLHTCNNCKHRYIPESPYDFFEKTFDIPDMCKWGDKNYEPDFWLCDSLDVSKLNYSSNKLIMKKCITQNFYGTCPYFKTENAIDINDKDVFIDSDNIDCFVDDEVELKVSIKETDSSNATEDTTSDTTEGSVENITNEIDFNNESENTTYENNNVIEDEDGKTNNLPDEKETSGGGEKTEEPVIIFKYQWYKNGRKLFNKKKDSIIINTKKESSDEYYCAVTESIEDNGDGGTKVITVNTNTVIVTISEKTETKAPSIPPINNDKDEEINDEAGTTEDIQP